MEEDVHHYDNTSRTGPKVFVGEWASTEGNPTPTLQAALGDAVWMIGMERNSDVIPISCYAPLLVNVNNGASQWGTNLIGYDALNSFGSPSYYAQQMFGENRGDVLLPVQCAFTTSPGAGPHGGIGVGTWQTQAEFKDIQVTQGDKVLLDPNTTMGADGWRKSGDWSTDGGVLRQSSGAEDCQATAGSADWTDYTLTLQARKISGNEGFLILFHHQDDQNFSWWNIGGWGNTRSGCETVIDGAKDPMGDSSGFKVETGRWYDLRIEVKGGDVQCFVNDKLVNHANENTRGTPDPIYATASRVNATGEVILKAVNTSDRDIDGAIQLRGVAGVSPEGKATVLTSASPQDQNTISDPTKVLPVEESITAAASFHHQFPAHSVTVLRLSAR